MNPVKDVQFQTRKCCTEQYASSRIDRAVCKRMHKQTVENTCIRANVSDFVSVIRILVAGLQLCQVPTCIAAAIYTCMPTPLATWPHMGFHESFHCVTSEARERKSKNLCSYIMLSNNLLVKASKGSKGAGSLSKSHSSPDQVEIRQIRFRNHTHTQSVWKLPKRGSAEILKVIFYSDRSLWLCDRQHALEHSEFTSC